MHFEKKKKVFNHLKVTNIADWVKLTSIKSNGICQDKFLKPKAIST